MKSHLLPIAFAVCGNCAIQIPRQEPAPEPTAAAAPAREERPARQRSDREVPPPRAAADPARAEQATAVIHEAMATYAASGVHSIRVYLLDPDPSVRQAARDGLVQLGEADAIPHLRAAAAKLEDPAEIASFHEAADLLALPPWSESAEARAAIAEITGGNPP
jgi:hypothetical protein